MRENLSFYSFSMPEQPAELASGNNTLFHMSPGYLDVCFLLADSAMPILDFCLACRTQFSHTLL